MALESFQSPFRDPIVAMYPVQDYYNMLTMDGQTFK